VFRPAIFCPQPLTIGPVDAGYSRSVSFSWSASVPTGAYTVTPSDTAIDGIRTTATTIRIG
jgi:hypothetical protein